MLSSPEDLGPSKTYFCTSEVFINLDSTQLGLQNRLSLAQQIRLGQAGFDCAVPGQKFFVLTLNGRI
jgi:hypothetical protein